VSEALIDASDCRRLIAGMFASRFCLFVKSPGTLSSRAALLDIFETMCWGHFWQNER
jgi:hypothetical protein